MCINIETSFNLAFVQMHDVLKLPMTQKQLENASAKNEVKLDDQKKIIAVFGADNQCVYVDQESFFKQIDEQFAEK